jgi:drug/metabolite transporter (DMT)-like permease
MSSDRENRIPRRSIPVGQGELWALGAALAYALYQVFLRVAVWGTEVNNLVGATVQAIPILLLAAGMGWVIKRPRADSVSPLSDWKLIWSLVLNGLLLFVVATPLLFAALREGGVLIASPLSGTQVLWAAGLAALLLREPFTRPMALGMVVSVGGIFVLTAGASGSFELSPTWWKAVPFALGVGFCWALAGVLLTYNLRRGVDGYQALTISTLAGVITINAYLLFTGDMDLYAGTPQGLLLTLLVAGTFSAVALASLTTALDLTTVASATTLNSIQVALGPLIAWVFLGEDMNLVIAAGILLILVGVILVQRERAAIDNK